MVEEDLSTEVSRATLSHHRSGNNQGMGGDREGAEREAISLGILVTWCTLSTSLPVSVQTYSSIFTGQFAVV